MHQGTHTAIDRLYAAVNNFTPKEKSTVLLMTSGGSMIHHIYAVYHILKEYVG